MTDCGMYRGLLTSSIWNGLFGRLADCACVMTVLWPAAAMPPQVGGSTGRVLPSISFCAT